MLVTAARLQFTRVFNLGINRLVERTFVLEKKEDDVRTWSMKCQEKEVAQTPGHHRLTIIAFPGGSATGDHD